MGHALPRTIGPFRIIDLLGEGGMGRVYRAEQTALGREVALKVLPAHIADRPGFRERFLREVRVLASINHPNVVTCYDAGEADGRVYMALELVTGGDVSDLVKAEGALHPRRALEIIRDAAAGLEAIEDAGLIHRDIKPANIFLTQRGVAKLADLGLARHSDGNDSITDPGKPLGTPSYMSPEQATGAADVDITTDVYALGATLYGLLAGKAPFAGDSPLEVIKQVLSVEAPDIRQLRPEVDARVSAVIARCLQKDPAKRYPQAGDLRQALDQLVELARQGFPDGRPVSPEGETERVQGRAQSSTKVRTIPDGSGRNPLISDGVTPSGGVAAIPDTTPLNVRALSEQSEAITPEAIAAFRRRLDPGKLARLIKRIHIAEDGLRAWMNLAPGASMPRVLLEVVLDAAGVVHGVCIPAVISASRPSTQPRRMVLATGDEPFPGVKGRRVTGEEIPPLACPLAIRVEDDGMSAWGYLEPGNLVERSIVERVVKESPVRFGILRENVVRLWEGPEVYAGRICLARGVPMAPTRPEGFTLVTGIGPPGSQQGLAQVSQGTVLAEWVEEEPGVKGMDVYGHAISPPPVVRQSPEQQAGEGTEVGRDQRGLLVLRATRDGLVQHRTDGSFRVVPAMEIRGDLGPDDPPLQTDDLVVVHGHVLPGAKITSASDVVVMGDLNDAVIEAGGSIEVQGDIVAGNGPVTAGDAIHVQGRVQRQIVAATLKITGTLDHCEVVATGDVEINKVIGGSVVAGGNLAVNIAGDNLGTTTELWAGHQPGMAEQNRVAELAERKVASERRRVLEDLRQQQDQLSAMKRRQALHAGAEYQSSAAMQGFHGRVQAGADRAQRLEAECLQARDRLADQRRANRELKAVTDNPEAHLTVRVSAHRGVVARVANADPLVVRRDQGELDLRLDDG